jgi:hypothetical protein
MSLREACNEVQIVFCQTKVDLEISFGKVLEHQISDRRPSQSDSLVLECLLT